MDVHWIKLSTELFNNKKIKKINRMPDSDKIFKIWIYLLVLAGKCNARGYIFITENIPIEYEDIADDLSYDINTIKLAMETFQRLDMIDIETDGKIFINDFGKHQNLDRLEKLREKNRLRVQKYREKKKKEANECNTKSNVSVTLPVTLPVTLCNTTDKTRRDKNRLDKNIKEIVQYLNEKCNKSFKFSTAKTKTCIKARLNEGFSVDDFRNVINIKSSQWLNDKKMDKYLRPVTLFGTKFESYLNEKPAKSNMRYKDAWIKDNNKRLKELGLIDD